MTDKQSERVTEVTLRGPQANPYPRTPAMAAGIADHVWTCEEIAAILG